MSDIRNNMSLNPIIEHLCVIYEIADTYNIIKYNNIGNKNLSILVECILWDIDVQKYLLGNNIHIHNQFWHHLTPSKVTRLLKTILNNLTTQQQIDIIRKHKQCYKLLIKTEKLDMAYKLIHKL
jgi:hypothetical protein